MHKSQDRQGARDQGTSVHTSAGDVGGRMIARRSVVLALGAGVLTAPRLVLAQQRPVEIVRIGFLGVGAASPAFADRLDAFRSGLADLGYIEGKNIVIEYRWAEGKYDRLDALAQELVQSKVAVIVSHTGLGVRAAMRATKTIPIVIAATGDAVESGLVASLARPGGNVTGLSFLGPEVVSKRIELLREALPQVRRIGILVNSTSPESAMQVEKMAAYALALKLELPRFGVKAREEFAGAFAAMGNGRIDAVVVTDEPVMTINIKTIADLAAKHKLPVIGAEALAGAGGLMGYGSNFADMFRRSATFVDKILKGAKPGDLAVEQPTKFDFLVNAKTAQALGLKLPQSILLRADRVID